MTWTAEIVVDCSWKIILDGSGHYCSNVVLRVF